MSKTILDIEKLLSKLRAVKARHLSHAADVQQHIDLIEAGQTELFPAPTTALKPTKK